MPPTVQSPKSPHSPADRRLSGIVVKFGAPPRPAEQRRQLPQVDLPSLYRSFGSTAQPVSLDLPLALHVHQAALLYDVTPQLLEGVLALGTDVDLEGFPVALHAGGGVDSVAEEAVAGHREADYSRHHGS